MRAPIMLGALQFHTSTQYIYIYIYIYICTEKRGGGAFYFKKKLIEEAEQLLKFWKASDGLGEGACFFSGRAAANEFQYFSIPLFFLKNINLNKA